MSNVKTAVQSRPVALAPEKLIPIVSALMLGLITVGAAGFVSTSAVHNAAHDQRHAIGFPCH